MAGRDPDGARERGETPATVHEEVARTRTVRIEAESAEGPEGGGAKTRHPERGRAEGSDSEGGHPAHGPSHADAPGRLRLRSHRQRRDEGRGRQHQVSND